MFNHQPAARLRLAINGFLNSKYCWAAICTTLVLPAAALTFAISPNFLGIGVAALYLGSVGLVWGASWADP